MFTYYGIFRYGSIYFTNIDKFIENYSTLPEASKSKIVVAFTTPSKQNKLKPFISSILDQTVKVNVINYVVKPGENIPDNYLSKIVNFVPSGKDYNEYSNITPILLKERSNDVIIISLSADYIYGKDFIENLLEESDKNPDTVILCSRGKVSLRKTQFADNNKEKYIDYSENYLIL